MRRVLPALLTALVVSAACGVGTQSRPEPIDIPAPSAAQPGSTGALDGPRVTVWFIRGARLEAAERPTERPGIDAALEALVAGPTRAEVVGGLRTALAPQSLMPDGTTTADRVVTIGVSREFTEVAGGNQLLASAQVVFTVTGLPGVEAVRITADGSPVEVPTDEGLTAEPVGRDDYGSVAGPDPGPPAADPAAPSTVPGTPPAPPSTAPPAGPSTPGRRRAGCHRTVRAVRVPADLLSG